MIDLNNNIILQSDPYQGWISHRISVKKSYDDLYTLSLTDLPQNSSKEIFLSCKTCSKSVL